MDDYSGMLIVNSSFEPARISVGEPSPNLSRTQCYSKKFILN